MLKALDMTPTLYAPAKAEAVAAALQTGDEDGWTYRVKHDPKGTGYSLIEVVDEDGEIVAMM